MQNRNEGSLFGIDLSEYNTGVDFSLLDRKIDFLFLRCSSSSRGYFRPDARFPQYAPLARRYGIPTGAYHYALPSRDLQTARDQAESFLAALQDGFGPGQFGDIYPVLDVEAPLDKSLSTRELIRWIETFRDRFETQTGRRLMLYTGAFFVELYDNFQVDGAFPLSSMPLWIAMYREIPSNPPVPPNVGGWDTWTVWQFTESGRVEGVNPPTDLNWGPNTLSALDLQE